MPEPKRPNKVNEAQAAFLRKFPACAITGSVGTTQAHHVIPYEYLCTIDREELAEEERIFLGLCETEKGKPEPNYHELVGHAGSFQSMNIHSVEDVDYFKAKGYKTTAEIEADSLYLSRKLTRPKKPDDMSQEELATLRAYVDQRWPKVAASKEEV